MASEWAAVTGFLPAFIRAGGFAFTAPLLGDPGTPVRARLLFAVAVAATVSSATPPADVHAAFARLPIELAAGILAGVSARFILDRAAAGGQLIGLHLGLGFAADYDPRAGESASAARRLVGAIAGLSFLAAGGIEAGVRAVAVPVTGFDLGAGLVGVVDLGASLMVHAMAFAAPILLAATVLNLGLALVNRVAPAFNAFSISLVVVLIGGGLVLYSTASSGADAIDASARAAVDALDGWGTR